METRVTSDNLTPTLERLRFDKFVVSEASRFSGGIVMAWKSEKVNVDVIYTYFQFLHINLKFSGGEEFLFTHVYASPREERHKDLWVELHQLS
ncbi:unnamed protein product [Lathyrus sativus]|nr:unnamed protein product [Lathyrus sativus]